MAKFVFFKKICSQQNGKINSNVLGKIFVNIFLGIFLSIYASTSPVTPVGCADSDSVLAHANTVPTTTPNNPLKNETKRKLAKVSDTTGYHTVAQYLKQRFRPKRHFLDMGSGLTAIEQNLFFYMNYRFRSKKFKKIALIWSIEYHPYFFKDDLDQKMSLLIGARYPLSSDLKKFYTNFLFGSSFLPYNFSDSDFPLEFRLLFTQIISPGDWPIRFYLQGGFPIQLTNWLFSNLETKWTVGISAQIGVDVHL